MLLAPLGALIVSPFRDPVPSHPSSPATYRFDCSNLFNMALTDQTKMKINESGREWMKVNECGRMWMKLDEFGWNWMKLDVIV